MQPLELERIEWSWNLLFTSYMTEGKLLILLNLSVLIYKMGSIIVTWYGIALKHSACHLASAQHIQVIIINEYS